MSIIDHLYHQLWSLIWDKDHGPDWVRERAAAMTALRVWKEKVVKDNDLSASLLKELCLRQAFFNGLGKHTASNFLFSLALWPGTPPVVICQDNQLFEWFADALQQYMEIWVGDDFRRECLSAPNLESPFAFNRWADLRYVRRYLWVFRKAEINMSVEQYNMYSSLGLFDRNHIIGERYLYSKHVIVTEHELQGQPTFLT